MPDGINELAYRAAHKKLGRDRGPAKNHKCLMCSARARHWAYDHLDPNEIQSDLGDFTHDQSHYWPLCYSCHYLLDHSVRRRKNGLGWETDKCPTIDTVVGDEDQDEPFVHWPPLARPLAQQEIGQS
jgi:hypothetical protein